MGVEECPRNLRPARSQVSRKGDSRRLLCFGMNRRLAIVRLAIVPLIVAIAIIVAWKLGYFELDRRQELYERVQRFRLLDGVELGFIAAYVLVVALCLSTTVMNVLGGALFGATFGIAFAVAGSQLGTVITYVIARRLARRPLQRIFGEHRLLRQLRERHGMLGLFRLRVLPIAPFGVLPYVSGLADVSLRKLLLASLLGALPQTVAYAWLGDALLSSAVSQGDATRRALWVAGGVTVVMLAISVLPSLLKRNRSDTTA